MTEEELRADAQEVTDTDLYFKSPGNFSTVEKYDYIEADNLEKVVFYFKW